MTCLYCPTPTRLYMVWGGKAHECVVAWSVHPEASRAQGSSSSLSPCFSETGSRTEPGVCCLSCVPGQQALRTCSLLPRARAPCQAGIQTQVLMPTEAALTHPASPHLSPVSIYTVTLVKPARLWWVVGQPWQSLAVRQSGDDPQGQLSPATWWNPEV